MGRVTGADGQVIGSPGLYVMDAAAFPGSVGVNPSATIAAIAEYKVERFVRSRLGKEGWCAEQFGPARQWVDANRDAIDPIGCIARSAGPQKSRPPDSRPIGIEFEEMMEGRGKEPNSPANCPQYGIQTCLHATIGDLSAYLEQHRIGKVPGIALEGRVTVQCPWMPAELRVRSGESWLRFSREPRSQGRPRIHRVDYHLVLEADGSHYLLDGHKNLCDDARFDVWEDATTVVFELEQNGKTQLEGLLRVPASTFFGVQVPSFRATNTDDPARRSWALAAFAKVFFGHLTAVYVPELGRVVDVAKNIVERTHV